MLQQSTTTSKLAAKSNYLNQPIDISYYDIEFIYIKAFRVIVDIFIAIKIYFLFIAQVYGYDYQTTFQIISLLGQD